jgi:hypothetical protein
MNYIKQLSAFFDKASDDISLNPSHISLYMALFQFWNINHFENPISISRAQTMKLSKIGSFHTYHKCLNDLHLLGYIVYLPSHNPLKGSLVNMCIFDTSTAQIEGVTCAKSVQVLHKFSGKIDTSTAQVLHPSINNINVLNNKKYREDQTQIENQNLNPENEKTDKHKKSKRDFIPPSLDESVEFFTSENHSKIEAQKFFNHFESNGWKVGGKSPMKNWNAAARNWMINSQRFIAPEGFPKPQQKPKPNPNNKNYSEPL